MFAIYINHFFPLPIKLLLKFLSFLWHFVPIVSLSSVTPNLNQNIPHVVYFIIGWVYELWPGGICCHDFFIRKPGSSVLSNWQSPVLSLTGLDNGYYPLDKVIFQYTINITTWQEFFFNIQPYSIHYQQYTDTFSILNYRYHTCTLRIHLSHVRCLHQKHWVARSLTISHPVAAPFSMHDKSDILPIKTCSI